MRKKFYLILFILFFAIIGLVSCGPSEESFSIKSSANEYLLEKKSNSDYKLTFSVATDKSNLKTYSVDDVIYYIDGDNNAQAVMVGNEFTASAEGIVKVAAKIGDLKSTNSLTINVKYSKEFLSSNEDDIINKIEEVSKKTIDFGSVVDIGISEASANYYHLNGCDDVMFINEQGKLEVCGVMSATEVELYSDITKKNIWVGELASTFGSIMATSVRNELINNKIISSRFDTITKNHVAQVKKLSLSGLITNDVTSIDGLKWLTGLEELDLSNNGIDNIDFASNAKNLKKLIVNNNNISDLEKLKEHKDIEYLDISNNNIENLNYVHRYKKLRYLDLSSNGISDITNVGNLSYLESLFLNNNKLKTFKDALAELNYLRELGLGNCGLTFNDIKSIQFIDKENITYLDFSETNINLENVVEFKNLETLILENADLSSSDISRINQLHNLKYLDISNNALNNSDLLVRTNDSEKFKLDANELRNLNTLCIGGNEFSSIPNLTDFINLNTLDLTNSYNLKSLDSLGKLNISELILDECNSIIIDDNGNKYLTAIGKNNLPNLEKLSIKSGLNYMTKDLYDYIVSMVIRGDFKLKFISDEYIDKNTIFNYKNSIFFSMNEFLNKAVSTESDKNLEKNIINSYTEEIILSLVNDRSASTKNKYYFYIPSTLTKVSIFGNEYDTYNIGFNIMERKQSSFTFDFISFKDNYTGSESLIYAEKGSLVNINTYLTCSLSSNSMLPTLNVWNLNIEVKSVSNNAKNNIGLKIENLYVPDKPAETIDKSAVFNYIDNYATAGKSGVTTVRGNEIKLKGYLLIIGGKGGEGGNAKSGWASAYGGDGGKGGTAVQYYSKYSALNTVTLEGGSGGTAGVGENYRMGNIDSTNYGKNGEKGLALEKI